MIYLGLLLAFFLGYYLRWLKDTVLGIKSRLEALQIAQKSIDSTPSQPTTTFAEPMSPVELAALLEEEKIKILNQQ